MNKDPYANAFSFNNRDIYSNDNTKLIPGVYERKYEVDSLAAALKLFYKYYKYTNDLTPFDGDYISAIQKIIKTSKNPNNLKIVREMQKPTSTEYTYEYYFSRRTSRQSETLQDGIGYPTPDINLV